MVRPPILFRDRLFANLLLAVTAVAFAGMLQFVWLARHWPLAHDAPLLRYVVFLISRGHAPYRDIVEINMPGTYMLESLGMAIFGPAAAGTWRLDVFSGLVILFACLWIASPRARIAAIFAGTFVIVQHLWDGPACLDQRDWYVAAFLLLGAGFCLHALRRRRPAWIAGAGLFSTISATIKPPYAIVGLGLLAAVLFYRRQPSLERGRRFSTIALWFLAGSALPLLAVALYLRHWHAAHAFVEALRGLIPYYAGLQRTPPGWLASYYAAHRPYLLAPIPLYILNHSWRRPQSNLLALATCLLALIFLAQAKGWIYQLYPVIALSAIWAAIEIQYAFGERGWWRPTAAAVVLLWLFFLARPLPLRSEPLPNYSMDHIALLQSDLTRLGGPALNKQVQCLDMTLAGCINVLYRMRLEQSTGFIYDFALFAPQANPTVLTLRGRFMYEITANPPKVIVLSAHIWPSDRYGYDELANFPAFQSFLAEHYTLDPATPASYIPEPNLWVNHPTSERLYRLYLLK
jgi:hypothetical protein